MAPEENSAFIQKYQNLYDKDPQGKIFAPLAEAYRRAGFQERALRIAEQGVRLHPHFPSGRVALARCYIDKQVWDKAAENLKVASDLSPENLLAHQLLADCFLKLGQKKEALNALKMVLFLNPQDMKTAQSVATLEKELFALHANQFIEESESKNKEDDEEYSMKPLSAAGKMLKPQAKTQSNLSTQNPAANAAATSIDQILERDLALFDTWFDRGDWSRAEQILKRLPPSFAQHPSVKERLARLQELTRTGLEQFDTEWISPLEQNQKSDKIQELEKLLSRVDSRKRSN